MHEPMTWSCDCGQVVVEIAAGPSTHCVCYCDSCQAFARHLRHEDTLDAQGGSHLMQTTPDRLTIRQGKDKLACLRLTSKGPLRWYTTCCNSPLANTGATRNLAFSSVVLAGVDNINHAGPVIARVNRKSALGHIDAPAGNVWKLVGAFLGRAVLARLNGSFRQTPFFGKDGRPVASPKRLSEEERAFAYDREAAR